MHSMDTDTDTVWYRRSAVAFQTMVSPCRTGWEALQQSDVNRVQMCSRDLSRHYEALKSCFVFFVFIYLWCLVIGTFPRQKRTTRKSEATTLALPHWISWFLFVFELPKWNVCWHIVSHSEASAQYTGGSCQILGFDRPAFFCLAAIIRHLNARKSKLNAIPTRSYEYT